MAGYGPAKMVQTPWGNAAELRTRMLRPGPGIPREEVAQSQRERLYAATVACIARAGYERTAVADLLELSGVSRSAFYDHFRDKEDCVLATHEAVVAIALERAERDFNSAGSGAERGGAALLALFEAAAAQPAAARLCFCDIYTVGRSGRRAAERASERFATLAGQAIADAGEGVELPERMVAGVLGGLLSVVQLHLNRGEEKALPGLAGPLWAWAASYEPPGVRLRSARRHRAAEAGPPPIAAYSQAERIVRALAAIAGERGYPAATIAEVAARASVSQATFYSRFPDREAALTAALDSADSQMLAVALPAARRTRDWASAVRAAVGGACAFYAAEPELARLATVELSAGGSPALEQRHRQTEGLRHLFAPAPFSSGQKPVVVDAVLGAMWALLCAEVLAGGPQSLPQVASLAGYMMLSPFLGAEIAAAVANGASLDAELSPASP